MNSSMLYQLRAYSPTFLPSGYVGDRNGYPIYYKLCLITKYGKYDGHIREFLEDDSSCTLVFETYEFILFIDVNDICMFNTLGDTTKKIKEQKIGFK